MTPPDPTAEAHEGAEAPGGVVFWVTAGLGAAVCAAGFLGLVTSEGAGLGSFIPWFAGGALAVDLIVVPVAAGIGLAGRRFTPPSAWPVVRAGLITATLLLVFASPLVLGLGGAGDNTTSRPRDYPAGLGAALLVTAVLTVAVATITAAIAAVGRRTRA